MADLRIDALQRTIRQGQREVRLSPQEHILLYTLVLNAGSVVPYLQLAKAIGRSRLQGSNNAVARHITGLRRKLGDDYHHPRYIETVVGIGYRCVVATD